MSQKRFKGLPSLNGETDRFSFFTRILSKITILPKKGEQKSALKRSSILIAGLIFIGFLSQFCLYLTNIGLLNNSPKLFAPLTQWEPDDNTIIYSKDDQVIAERYSNFHVYVPYAKIPKTLINAIIATEDRAFFQHHGIDPRSMLRAGLVFLRSGFGKFTQGASTITQQLVRNFLLPNEKTIDRKIKEILLALKLEAYLSKEKILEIYVNSLFLGDGSYGVGAASKRYFGKNLSELKPHQHALIAGLFQSPSRYNPHRYPMRAKKRQRKVLSSMLMARYIDKHEAKTLFSKPMEYQEYNSLHGQVAPYFIDFINEQAKEILKINTIKNQGLRIYTTLDLEIQGKAESSVTANLELLEATEKNMPRSPDQEHSPLEVAMLVSNVKNGEILAMIGGRDYHKSQFNRAFNALRQPGSAFKPIVYSLALESGAKWSDVFYVSPITLAGNYRPRSTESDYMTQTTLLRAFYRSMNATTLEVSQSLGIEALMLHAKKLGMRSLLKKEFGTMLGSSECTMFDLARLNGAIANRGKLVELVGITKIEDHSGSLLYSAPSIEDRTTQVLSPQTAFLMTQGMRQVLARGTGWSQSHLNRWAAGKTGTSNESRDNWFTGFTPETAIITWVGSDDSSPIYGNSHGASLALPIWGALTESILSMGQATEFIPPEGLRSFRTNPRTGQLSKKGISMWFRDGEGPGRKKSKIGVYSKSQGFRNPMVQ